MFAFAFTANVNNCVYELKRYFVFRKEATLVAILAFTSEADIFFKVMKVSVTLTER